MITLPKLLIILATCFSILLTPDRLSAEAKIESNIVYGMHSGLALLMDVHYPASPNGSGIIVIPGSGWHQPLSYEAKQLKIDGVYLRSILCAKLLLENGYTLFVINHRSAPVFRYPAPVEDAQRAVRFIRHHAERYGINPDRIGAIGHSSGAHLVSMLGTMDGAGNPEDLSSVNQESSKVQAVVALAPAIDLVAQARDSEGDPSAPSTSAISSFMGTWLAFFRDRNIQQIEFLLYEEASPTTYVTPDDPPFLLVHGDEDEIVPFSQSEILLAKLNEVGVTAELVAIKGGKHNLRTADSKGTENEAYYGKMIELFSRNLRGDP